LINVPGWKWFIRIDKNFLGKTQAGYKIQILRILVKCIFQLINGDGELFWTGDIWAAFWQD
jgi:hypothetical protein